MSDLQMALFSMADAVEGARPVSPEGSSSLLLFVFKIHNHRQMVGYAGSMQYLYI